MARRTIIDNDQPQGSPSPAFVRYGTGKFDAVLRLVVLPIEVEDVANMLDVDLASMMAALAAYEATHVPIRCTDYSVEAKLRSLGNLHSIIMLTPLEKEKVSAFLVAAIELELMNVEGAMNRAKKFNTVLSTIVAEDVSTDSGDDVDEETEDDRERNTLTERQIVAMKRRFSDQDMSPELATMLRCCEIEYLWQACKLSNASIYAMIKAFLVANRILLDRDIRITAIQTELAGLLRSHRLSLSMAFDETLFISSH